MKTFLDSYSKQLEQCIFPRMFVRNGPLSFEGGEEGTGKFPRNNRVLQKHEEKNRANGTMAKNIEQVLLLPLV